MAEPSNSQPEASAPDAPLRSPVRVALVTAGDAAPAPLLEALAERGVDLERARSVFDAMAIVTRAAASLRARRSGAEAAGQAELATPVALLLVEPERIERAEELVAAVQRYAPGVVIWRYDASSAIPLRGYDGSAARHQTAKRASVASDPLRPRDECAPVVTKRARPVSEATGERADSAAATGSPDDQPRLRLTDHIDDADPQSEAKEAPDSGAEAAQRPCEDALAQDIGADDPPSAARPGDDALLTPEELAMLLGEEDDAPKGSP